MSNLKPLKWGKDGKKWTAYGAGISYTITEFDGVAKVGWHNMVKSAKDLPFSSDKKTLASCAEAVAFVEKEHYPHFMSEFVQQDSISDINAWFKAAKPEPTDKDICTQIGCHYEEVYEMDAALYGYEPSHNGEIADWYKGDSISVVNVIERMDKIGLLDALCDQIVTAVGVGYMMGFDMLGALREVIRSNNSKMVNGKFEYDDNGKVMKPEGYSKPELERFLGDSNDK